MTWREDTSAEMLLMHAPLADVLAFVNARDEVRAMVSAVVDEPPSSYADTVPLPNSTTAPPSTLPQGSR